MLPFPKKNYPEKEQVVKLFNQWQLEKTKA
jgi:hypothetical protein